MNTRILRRRSLFRAEPHVARINLLLPVSRPGRMPWVAGGLAGMFILSMVFHGQVEIPPVPPGEDAPLLIVETAEEPPPVPVPPEAPRPPPVPAPAASVTQEKPPPETEAAPEPAAAPELGLAAEDLGAGAAAVRAGNSLAVKADTVAAPPPPKPRPAPVALERMPSVVAKVVPEYPAWAEEQAIPAQVVLLLTIDEKGEVTQAEVLASGGQDFDENALRAGRLTRFQPWMRSGQAVPAKFRMTYDFVP